MQILLCAATELEIRPAMEYIERNGLKNIKICITGVGLTSSTYQITKAIINNNPQLVLQAGVAGSLDQNSELGKVVVVRNEYIGDLGVKEGTGFSSLVDLELLQTDEHPYKQAKLTNHTGLPESSGLEIVDGVTVNEISTDENRIGYYRSKLGAGVESMEGAALHFVALMESKKFLQLRGLSNFIGERNKSKWQLDKAISNLNEELIKLIKKY